MESNNNNTIIENNNDIPLDQNIDLEKQIFNQKYDTLKNEEEIINDHNIRASISIPIVEDIKFIKEDGVTHNLDSAKLPFDSKRYLSSNKPKILLEVVSWKMGLAIIFLTYAVFIIASLIDFFNTYYSFKNDGHNLSAQNCSLQILNSGNNWGCSYSIDSGFLQNITGIGINNQTNKELKRLNVTESQVWIGTVTNLENVIFFNLQVKQYNFQWYFKLLNLNTIAFQIQYKIRVWSCFSSKGCGYGTDTVFLSPDKYNANPHQWQQVLEWDDEYDVQLQSNLNYYNDPNNAYKAFLLGNTFQNQESIPTNGLVKSYFIVIEYVNHPLLFSVYHSDTAQISTAPSIEYDFTVFSRPDQTAADIINIILFCITVVILIWFIRMIHFQKANIMSQQKWVIFYFVILILFQNPIYMVIVWIDNPRSGSVFTCYLFDFMAQAGLLLLYLIFSDTFRRISLSFFKFYGPKAVIALGILVTSIVYLIYMFPGVVNNNYGDPALSHSPVEEIGNWSVQLQNRVVAVLIIYIAILITWLFVWIIRYCKTKWWLSTLPFTPTRYIQLSFRFWVFQAILVTIYFIFQYSVLIVYLLQLSFSHSKTQIDDFIEAISILNAQQTQQFGKVLMLSVYAFTMAYLFQAAPERSEDSLLDRTVYAITEVEKIQLLKKDKINAKRNNTEEKVIDVFCIDIAIFLRSISFQCYYDPKQIKTNSGFEGSMNLSRIGFTLIDLYYGEDHELFCIIAREDATDRIVVSFRGTASQRQMEDNLNYSQEVVDIEKELLTDLDEQDGLQLTEQDALLMKNFFETVENNEEILSFMKRGCTVSETLETNDNGLAAAIMKQAANTERAFEKTVGEVTSIAVNNVPIIHNLFDYKIHCGWWNAYKTVRSFIHSRLRKELKVNPADIFFTGHSLGGALATIAALDVTIHTIPRVNMFYQLRKWENLDVNMNIHIDSQGPGTKGRRPMFKRFKRNDSVESKKKFTSVSKVFMYNYGSPRVGNENFKDYYNSKVPRSYRIVVEGDVITTLPPPDKYSHIGTEILIDSSGSGSIIIEPNFVERWLKASTVYSSMAAHSLLVYRKGLLSVKIAAEYAHLSDSELLSQTRNVHIGDRVKDIKDENLASPINISMRNLDLNETDIFVDTNDGKSDKNDIVLNRRNKLIKSMSIMDIVDIYEKNNEDYEEEKSYQLMEKQNNFESLLNLGGTIKPNRGGILMKRQSAKQIKHYENL